MASTAELEAEILADLEENPDAYTTPVNDVITIDPETRTINIPASETLFGTEQEMNVERKYFKCPKIVGDNIDLSKHQIYITYVTARDNTGTFLPEEEPGLYYCEDMAVDGDYITFSWLLSGNVLRNHGFIAFAVSAKHMDGEVLKTRWKTKPAVGTVLLTVPDGEAIEERYPDVITQLLDKMNAVEEIATPEAMQNYVDAYFGRNPVQLDSTLTDNTKAAPAGMVGELRGDLVNINPNNFSEKYRIYSRNLYDDKTMYIDKMAVSITDGTINRTIQYFTLEIPVEFGKSYRFYRYKDNILTAVSVRWAFYNKKYTESDAECVSFGTSASSSSKLAPSNATYLYYSDTLSHLEEYDGILVADVTDGEPTDFVNYGAEYINGLLIKGLQPILDTYSSFSDKVEYLFPYDAKSNIPTYWNDYLDEKIGNIKAKQDSIGRNCATWMQFTDWHYNLNVKHSPQIIRYVADKLNVRYIINTGDNSVRLTNEERSLHYQHFEEINGMFSSIMDKILISAGNHDSLVSDINDDGTNINTWMTESEMYSRFYAPYLAHHKNAIVGEGNYYYVDDDIDNIRYISLDCFDVPNDTDYYRGKVFCYSKKQIQWLYNVALQTPPHWNVIVFSHITPTLVAGSYAPVGGDLVSRILRAYNNHISISYEYDVANDRHVQSTIDKTDTRYNVPMATYDFSTGTGKIIMCTSGHYHHDQSKTIKGSGYTKPIMLHTMSLDGVDEHQGKSGYEDIYIKTEGTTTEQAFDVYLYDRGSGDVFCYRIGAGDTVADWTFNVNNPVVN